MPPILREAGSDGDWAEFMDASPAAVFVVHTPSATAHVARIFPGTPETARWCIREEPRAEDFSRLERAGDFRPGLVVGIGGGRALDAAKVVAHWGHGYGSVEELRRVLQGGGRIGGTGRARLLLAPTLASSGSESSKGAIVTLGNCKTGLRGDSLQADWVIHDPRLWAGLPAEARRHYAFDVFAHLLETTVSRRRTPLAAEHAAEGGAHFRRWLEVGEDASPAAYRPAMLAAFHAGVCLGASSTCLPHRVQYVVGPATGTGHVEGIWMLAAPWLGLLARAAPERLEEAGVILAGRALPRGGLTEMFRLIHSRSGQGVRADRFRLSAESVPTLAGRVSGDLAADPCHEDGSTIENLLSTLAR